MLPYNRGMRYVRQAGSDPSFLLKALGEASGELQRAFQGLHPRQLTQPGRGQDDGWCLQAIPYHVRQTELGFLRQFEAIAGSRRESPIPHVDFDDIPFKEDYDETDEEEMLEEFHYLRRRTTAMLWELAEPEWDRAGIHPYRGRMTIRQLTREMYQHDLEHLWQTRRMIDALTSRAR